MFFATPLRDMRTIAQRLIERFGSYANVISASTDELRSVNGVEIEVLTAFKLIRSAVIYLLREEVRTMPIMGNLESLSRYLRGLLGRERGECLHILFLDVKNYLIADEIVFYGSVKTVQFDLRRVVERIIYYNASAIIIVHNHPSGDPKPNRFDIELTEKVRDFLLELDVAVHDHIIVSTNACFSLVRGITL